MTSLLYEHSTIDHNCLICNTPQTHTSKFISNIFDDDGDDDKILPHGTKLSDILSELVSDEINDNTSSTLCVKCYKSCVNYEVMKYRINQIKSEVSNQYEKTLQSKLQESPGKDKSKPLNKPIVVQASKLVPLPPDYQLNFAQFATGYRINKPETPQINLKVTIGTSVLTQSLTTSTVKISKPVTEIESQNDITKWSNSLPKEIFSTNFVEVNGRPDDWCAGDGDNNDDNGMEIDEDCTMAVVKNEQELNKTNDAQEIPEMTDHQYINVNVLQNIEGTEESADNFVMGKLRILQERDEDGEQHTIVVDGDNESVLEMMKGHKFVYDNGELSLVMDDDVKQSTEDESDSNDYESQIELQVSGDEETANAIIAAAQEHGGAFIKVESGEMYRVKSVQSKNVENNNTDTVMQIVAKEGGKYKCLLCTKTQNSKNFVSDAEGIMKHLKTVHDAKIYVCQLCGVIMRRRNDYQKHMAEHSNKISQKTNGSYSKLKLHECEICKKSYNSRTLLQEHMNTHTGSRPYTCHLCRKSFASKYTHQAHLKTHQVRPRPYKCKQCGKQFLTQQNLKQHEKTHSGVKNFVCNICKKAFGTQHNLEVHGVVHSGEKSHSCQTCGKSFARRAELLDHVRTHTGERPFACETCGARFSQRSNLHSHRRATHLGDRRHACDICNKKFKRRRLLQYHIKATHTGERPLKCEVCFLTFVYPEHYKKHVKKHTGEKAFSCEICGKSFNSRDNRNTHRFVHSDKKPYECLTCGASYMRKRLLIAHMNTSGHLAESIVVNQPRVTRVNENGVATIVNMNTDDLNIVVETPNDATFETTGELKLLDASTNSLKLEDVEGPKLYISADDLKMENSESTFIQTLDASQLAQSNISEETSGILRLIQVKLPDGNDGWVALND